MRRRSRFVSVAALGAAGLSAAVGARPASADVFNQPAGASWNVGANWSSGTVPNAIGANATFNGAATASNPDQTANRTITLDGAKTVGSILFNNDLAAFTNSITTGTGGPLTLDEAAAGPATITTQGTGTGNNTISVAMVLTDPVLATVNNLTATSGAGSLNITAAVSGPGGFTKQGAGLMTFGTGAKTYAGPTLLDTNSGRTRMSLLASPTATSEFRVRSGAQLELISAGTYALGTGSVFLNGNGPVAPSPQAAFPGAIRPASNLDIRLTNPVVLESDTSVNIFRAGGAGPGSFMFDSTISGPGMLIAGGAGAGNSGIVALNAANTYAGGSVVRMGLLTAGSANPSSIASSPLASFGTGNVSVEPDNGAPANLEIRSGSPAAASRTTPTPASPSSTPG
jgi:autotransporter-associated beta strand protein